MHPDNVPQYPGYLFKQGAGGHYIKYIQQVLRTRTDGIFGKKTKGAVVRFQKLYGLNPDGIVGPNTWSMLFRTNYIWLINDTPYTVSTKVFYADYNEGRLGCNRERSFPLYPYTATLVRTGNAPDIQTVVQVSHPKDRYVFFSSPVPAKYPITLSSIYRAKDNRKYMLVHKKSKLCS